MENLQESVPDLRLLYAESRKIRCLFERVLGAVPRPSIHYTFRQSSIQKEHDCFKYFFGISIKEDKKKENRLCSEELLRNI